MDIQNAGASDQILTELFELRGRVVELETSQRQAEGLRQQSEEIYRVIYNNEIYAIFVFDLETGQLLDVNEAATRLYGYSKTELLSGMIAHDLSAEPQASEASIRQAVREGARFIPQGRHRKKDGTVFPVEIVGGSYQWQGRRIMFALIHDISERQQVDQALQASERKFRQVVEQSADAIVLANETGQLVEWNSEAERITGLTRAEVLGRLIWDVQYAKGG